ncbi:hypothetical protein CFC21_086345 [Triticum aestivum]|uniref:Uncharacterized protein n=2 Tax=Triticum aestivum TaxID=4565 RepID=A0A9R1IEW2_WHEAT|nr:hypothetical protein CFC21_086345 [Triticum aestivum]
MLRLRCPILAQLLSSPSASTISPLHRLFSATTPRISPNRSFAVEEYLVSTCGLTRAQALKASTELAHLKSPSNPDAVLAFLVGLGFSRADVAAAANSYLLSSNLERVVKPNVAVLRECGICAGDIVWVLIRVKRILTTCPERVRAMAACAERIGVPRDSGMFRQALRSVVNLGEEEITAKVEYLKNTFSWTDAEVGIAVSTAPMLLQSSKDFLRSRSEFLISEVGLEPAYIPHRSTMLTYSLEGRLRPRYHILKFLKENGLLEHKRSYYSVVLMTEKVFMEKFLCPHNEAAPHLAEDYAAACKGEMPTNLISTSTKKGL